MTSPLPTFIPTKPPEPRDLLGTRVFIEEGELTHPDNETLPATPGYRVYYRLSTNLRDPLPKYYSPSNAQKVAQKTNQLFHDLRSMEEAARLDPTKPSPMSPFPLTNSTCILIRQSTCDRLQNAWEQHQTQNHSRFFLFGSRKPATPQNDTVKKITQTIQEIQQKRSKKQSGTQHTSFVPSSFKEPKPQQQTDLSDLLLNDTNL